MSAPRHDVRREIKPLTFKRLPASVDKLKQRWRYIRHNNGSEELYDYDADPHEWNNLAADAEFDAVKRQLRGQLPSSINPH